MPSMKIQCVLPQTPPPTDKTCLVQRAKTNFPKCANRVSEKLEEVLAKIKTKQQEQAHDDRFDKQLAELDKKAAMANRSRGNSKGNTGQSGAAKDDPYSRKRIVEKVYWSTGQRNAVSSSTKEAAKVEEEQVCTTDKCCTRFGMKIAYAWNV